MDKIATVKNKVKYAEWITMVEDCRNSGLPVRVIGVYIHRMINLAGYTSIACDRHTVIGYYDNGNPAYFDNVAKGIYDYVNQDGYNNLDAWVEAAVRKTERG